MVSRGVAHSCRATHTAPNSLNFGSHGKTLSDVAKQVGADDSCWLLTLGHGDHDGRRNSRFHVSGRDPTEADWPRWLADVKCREQVIWLTHSSSGWLLKPLSKPGRVIIAATEAADELNETGATTHSPRSGSSRRRTAMPIVTAAFRSPICSARRGRHEQAFCHEQHLPTEHAQLDDNGDGRGSEELALPNTKDPEANDVKAKGGNFQARFFLPWTVK